MSDEVCGIPRSVFESRNLTEDDIIQARKGYDLYQQLMARRNTDRKVVCECGSIRSATDRYRCRRTKKHKLLCELRKDAA